MPQKKTLIEFEKINLGYEKRTVLHNINMKINSGDYVGIVGPNGSGKTTLLRSILGWIKPSYGKITQDKNIRFGYVPQRNSMDPLFPLTALDVVLMGLYASLTPIQRLSKKQRQAGAKALQSVGLEGKDNILFKELSGGQQQRVLLARALASQPDILILDEPTNGMDIVSEASVMETVQKIHDEGAMTIVIVTHLLHVVAKYAQTVGLIKGDTIEFGATGDLLTSKHLSELYGTSIHVGQVQGHTVVVTK